MTRTRWILVALSIVVLMGVGLLAAYWSSERSPPMRPPSSPTDAEGLLREATPADILEYAKQQHGQLYLLNIWASWCEPCKAEFPTLLSAQKKFGKRGLKLLLVTVDDVGDFGQATAFLKSTGVDFPSFAKGHQGLEFITDLYPNWSGAVPASLLLGPDLKLLDAWEGETTAEELEARIRTKLRGS